MRASDGRAENRRGSCGLVRHLTSADVSEDAKQLARRVIGLCREAGFALAGVCEARPSDRAREMREWLAAGKHGSMLWLEEHLEKRLDVRLMLAGARSVIMVGDVYASGQPVCGNDPRADDERPRGRIARYAQGVDYHEVIKKRLHALSDRLRIEHPGAEFRTMVDVMPFAEREHALRAGLGWVGKHTLVIHPRLGSWFALGGIATTLELDPPEELRPIADACGTCTRCIDACPTGAIAPYSVDASRCISYLTVERRPAIDPALHGAIGEWLFGCDICQEVCPHNRERVDPADAVNPAYGRRNESFDLLEVLGWTMEARSVALSKSALKRATAAMWKRNALIVAGNSLARRRDEALLARVREIGADQNEPEMVRETARDVLVALDR